MPAEHELCLVCSTWGWLLNDKEWVESPEEHEKEVLRAGKQGENLTELIVEKPGRGSAGSMLLTRLHGALVPSQ